MKIVKIVNSIGKFNIVKNVGNAVSVPVAEWLARRIAKELTTANSGT